MRTRTAESKSISRRISRKILRNTTAVFVAAIICVGIISYSVVINLSNNNARRAISNSILEIEKVLTDVESASNISAQIAQKYFGTSMDIGELPEETLSADTALIACGIAFEPYKYKSNRKYYMTLSTEDEITKEISTGIKGGNEYDYLTMDWYIIPKLTGKAYWNEPVYDEGGSSKMITTYSIPLYDRYGEFFGVFRSDVSLEWLTLIIDKFRPYKNAHTLIVGKSGTFISNPNKEMILNETIYTNCLSRGDQKLINLCQQVMRGETGISPYSIGGTKYYAVYAPLLNGWRAIGLCARNDLLMDARVINISLSLIAILGLLILYVSSRRTITRETKLITEFAYSAMNMSRGNFHVNIPVVNTNDELQRLHDALSYLQSSFNRYITEMKTATSSKERMESELSIASMVQKSMLIHTFPQDEKFDIYADLIPAKEIGGDLYDVIHDGKNLFLTVGDVSGKGVPASLFMAITRSAFRFATSLGLSVAESVSRINDNFIVGNERGMFVTLFVAKINLETLEMEYCNAGHNPIIVVTPDGKANFMRAKPNIAAGLYEGFPYVGESLKLEKGSRLLIYTDGVTEAETRSKNQYGDDRLLSFASNINTDTSSQEVVENLLASVKDFAAGNEQNDDITIMTLKL